VTFEVSPIICDTIITDEEWLWQMLLNLLTNACKYTDHGSIHVKVTLAPPPAEQSSDKTVAPVPTPRAEPKGAQSVMAIEMVPIVSAEHMLFEVHDTGKCLQYRSLWLWKVANNILEF
jgi:signal transduction histidine kinase